VVSKANNLSRAARASAAAVAWVEMKFPDMPAALYGGAVAAYATGEPFGTVAEAGYARPLYMTRGGRHDQPSHPL
jgi:ABC-type nitrate/sulfonate/bicarbonate transport system substrate-binding protein